jgi:SAM-dependent methyltransferase
MDDLPQVSILIPNFNNGRAGSRSGRRDFIADLLSSLHATLLDDPTPLEIIIADDGSTDDSLQTCREWAARPWKGRRGEAPFCRLLEMEHTGVLSIVANRLTREARGQIVCRLDGDVIAVTPHWAARIVEAFAQGPPRLGVIGPKQLMLDGRIHAAGSWILHPRGHHHLGQGAPADAVTRAIEVDHVMGCFYCHRRAVWEQIDGYDETMLRGQTVDFGLRARLAGWQAFAIPNVAFIHAHEDRAPRANDADTAAGIDRSLDRFEAKWGFSRLAPDLADVADRYAGTPLLWNARFFGPALAWPPVSDVPVSIATTEWQRYADDEAFRAAIDARVRLVDAVVGAAGPGPEGRSILHAYSRAGLLAHLLARAGHAAIGIDPDPHRIELARTACAGGPDVRFERIDAERHWPVEPGTVDTVLLCDVLEHHRNPVGVLRAAHRILSEDGVLVCAVRERPGPFADDVDRTHPYRPHELQLQLQGTGLFAPIGGAELPDVPGMVTMLARPLAATDQSSEPVPAGATCST